MKTKPLYPAACLAVLLQSAVLARAQIRHDFVAIDEGMGDLFRVDENDTSKDWLVHINHEHPRDLQLEGNGRLLMSHDAGWSEYDLATGKLLNDVGQYHDVSSARRLENGDLLIAGVDFDRPKTNRGDAPVGDPNGRHVVVAEFDPSGKTEVRRTTYVGDYLRLLRQTNAGTYLFSCNTMFREADRNGNYIRTIAVPGFTHAWEALRLSNGDTLMSAGYGTTLKGGSSFFVEVAGDDHVVRRFGGAGQVPAAERPYFYGLFQVMPNGDVISANWQGHGPVSGDRHTHSMNHGNEGWQIVQFDPQGSIIWHWLNREHVAFSSIQAVLVLDGLDPSRLYDQRDGVEEPLR